MTPDKKVVWKYEAKPKEGYKGRIEIHAFQRLDDGNTMVAESGNARHRRGRSGRQGRQGGAADGGQAERPPRHADGPQARQRQLPRLPRGRRQGPRVRRRRARSSGPTRSTSAAGRESPGHGPEGHGTAVYGAVRLPNGNTLIGAGNGNRVIEVTPDGKIVWELGQDELPGIKLAWVTMLQVLPNGNVIVGNCHAGKDNPQLFEVTRDKKVVWTFKDFKTFGNGLAASQVLGIKGKVIR